MSSHEVAKRGQKSAQRISVIARMPDEVIVLASRPYSPIKKSISSADNPLMKKMLVQRLLGLAGGLGSLDQKRSLFGSLSRQQTAT
jgi:hypothetical protein